MPQLDISTFAPQIFWLAVTFIVLYLLMAKVGLPRVQATLAGRRARLDDDLGRAAALRTEAEAALAAYRKALAEARANAQETLRQTSDRLAAEAAERQRELTAALNARIAAAEQRIAEDKTRALREIRGVAADVGGAVVEKLTGAAPDAAQLADAVGRALERRTA